MMEARKRAASPDSIGPSSKKRIISASDWSKPISVTVQKTEDDDEGEDIAGDQLERFQKEAIFRRMRHYSRLKDELSLRVQDLEKRLRRSEAVVGAVEACWDQLVSQAQALVPTGLPPLEPSVLELYDMSRSFPPPKNDEDPPVSALFETQLRKTDLEDFKALRLEFETLLEAQALAKIEEMKGQIEKLQADNTRLRSVRDSFMADNSTYKAKDMKLSGTISGLKSTVASQKSRIATLENEARRLRAALAVESADPDYYAFIANNQEENESYVGSLKAKLKAAESRLSALEDTLKDLDTSHPDVAKSAKSEAEARQLYADTKEQLEKYERVYGSTSGSASGSESEHQKLLSLLAEKEEALRSFKALKREEDERLHGQPTAMDDLCRQIEDLIGTKEKEAANIASLEAKINKAVVEKSKADNKYYAAMRQKDTIEAERNSLATHRERQATRIEQMQALEQSLRQQVLEKELKERQELAESRRHQMRKFEEEVIRLKRDVTRAEYQAENLVPRSGSPSELTKTNENLLSAQKTSAPMYS
ncbi:hypothetical protein FRC00_013353 [Tulasnella sp. 408]|nr:hypothetical protein FRC00_013353 [Tulasnella sp. 408]